MPPTPKIEKIQKWLKNVKMHIIKKMTFYKVSDKTDIGFEFSVKNCVFQHWSKLILAMFWKMSDFETYNLKNSLKCSVSGLGNIKKRFLMVERCLEHSSKLSLVRKIIFLGITSQRNIRFETERSCFFNGWLETMPKDAPWCTDHFSYWMTPPRIIFGG